MVPMGSDTTGPKLCNDFDDCGGAAQPCAPRLRMSYIDYQESGFDPATLRGSFSGLPAWGGSFHDTEGRPDTNGAPNNQSPPDLKDANGIHPNHGLVGTPAIPGPGITPRIFSARRSFTEDALAEWVHGNRTRGQQNVPNQQNREVLSSRTTHKAPSLLGASKQISSKSTTMSLGCQTEPDMWYVPDVPKEGGAPKAQNNRSTRSCFSWF